MKRIRQQHLNKSRRHLKKKKKSKILSDIYDQEILKIFS